MKMDSFGQIILGAGVTAGFHPVSYVKTLIQIGYEPLPPTPTTSIFGRKVLAYPGLFKYLGEIRKQDGFLGMYRGLGARLTGGIIGSLVTNAVSIQIRGEPFQRKASNQQAAELDGDDESAVDQLMVLLKDTCFETVTRCTGVIIAHPFHVIMVRQMAQFVGKETEHSGLFSSIGTIYEKEGILGFFVGLVPRLCGEVLTIWLANALAHIMNNYLLPKTEGAMHGAPPPYEDIEDPLVPLNEIDTGDQDGRHEPGLDGEGEGNQLILEFSWRQLLNLNNMKQLFGMGAFYMKSYTSAISSLMVTQVTYPFMLVSNVMAVNNTGLRAGHPPISPIYDSWVDCWRQLSRANALKRGSSVFMRYYKGPVTFRQDGTMTPARF